MDDNKKKTWINVIKGGAILSVIFQHTTTIMPLSKFILLFHMPLFFYISGYCFNSSNLAKIKCYRKKILISSFKIYVIFSLIGFLYWLIRLIVSGNFDLVIIIKSFCGILYGNQITFGMVSAGMWFVATLMITKIIFSFIVKSTESASLPKNIFYGIVMIIIAVSTNYKKISILPFCLDNVKFAIIFYYLGYLMRKYRVLGLIDSLKEVLVVSLSTALFIIAFIFANVNFVAVHMYENVYGNYIYFFLGSICAILASFILVYKIREKHIDAFFGYFGKDTIYFFTMQFIVLDGVKYIIAHLSVGYPVIISHLLHFISFPIVVLLLIPIDSLMKKYLSPLLR